MLHKFGRGWINFPQKAAIGIALLLAVLTLTGLGCGRGGATQQLLPEPAPTPAPIPQAEAVTSPVNLPDPGELAKAVVYLAENRVRDGATFETALPFTSANLLAAEPLGVYSPQWTDGPGMSLTDMAYGIYSFALPDYDQVGTVEANWLDGFAPRDGQAWYLGLADFDHNSWHWLAGNQSGSLPVGDFAPYLSPSGLALVVVAVLGTDECRLERLRIGGNILPEVDLQADVSYGPPALTVNFDASASLDHDGEIALFSWDFDGDGAADLEGATETQVQHTYSTSGDYPATLTVTDNEGGVTVVVVEIYVNLPPSASLSANPLAGSAPLTVAFNAGGSTDPENQLTDIQWDFDGDSVFNEAGAEQGYQGEAVANYTYNSRGSYSPGVKVVDHHGEESVATVDISVNAPPNAVLSATPLVGQVPIDISFTGSLSTDSDGTIEDYEWDFDGDGTFNEPGGEADSRGIADPLYTYTVQGGYNATLRVTDNDGGQASAVQFIELGGPWEHSWGLSGDEKFYGVVADSAGNIFATGDAPNPTDGVLLAKFGPSGSLQWTKTWHPQTSGRACHGRGIAADSSGNIYVTGHLAMRDDGKDYDLLLLKFNNDGGLLWDVSWGGGYTYVVENNPLPEILEITRHEYGADIAVNPAGDIFVTGHAYYDEYIYFETITPPYYFENTITITTMVLVKFDADGTLVFQQDYNIGDNSQGKGIALDNTNGLVYCAGMGMSVGIENALVAAWDQTGAFRQAFKWGSTGSNLAYGICVGPGENIVVTGETNGFGQGGYDAFVFQAEPFSNAEPQLIWERSWGGSGTDAAVDAIWDSAASQFVVGGLTNSVGHGGFDMFSLAYASDGTLNSQQAWGTGGDELGLSTGYNAAYGLPLAVGIAPHTSGASWTPVSGTGAGITGTWTRRAGDKLDVAYDAVFGEGSLSSISGVLDTGGGNEDGLVMQFTP